MQFTFPLFLWALSLLAIPIIIHLFYFRKYKKVLFTNVHFLKELVEETATRNKIKNLLILISRLLALAAIILAFAQPFLNQDQNIRKTNQAISIYIDNSWSMNASSEDGLLIHDAKRKAKDIIESFTENDRFQIITNTLEGKHQRFVSKLDASTLLEEVECGPYVQNLSKIVGRIKQCYQNAQLSHGEIYLISDFQESVCDLEAIEKDSLFPVYLIPVQSIQENNLGIDTAYFVSPVLLPGQSNSLVYKVSNYGVTDADDVRSSYVLNGQEYPAKSLKIQAGKHIIDTLSISFNTNGWQKIIVKIKDYPIQFDDQYYISCKTENEINVLLLYSKELPQTLVKALESIPYFKSTAVPQSNVNYSKFKEQQLIILHELSEISTGLASELQKNLSEGVNVLVFPVPDLIPSNYSSLQTTLGLAELREFDRVKKESMKVDMEADVFKDVFRNKNAQIKLPSTFGQYSFYGGRPSEKIIIYRDGSSMLNRYKIGNGYLYNSAAPLNPQYSELSKSAEVFLPLLFKSAFYSGRVSQVSYDLSSNPVIPWPLEGTTFKGDLYLNLSGPEEFIPSIRIVNNQILIEVYDQIKKSGIYDLKNQTEVLGSIAFNDSRIESNPKVKKQNQLEELYGSFAKIIKIKGNQDITSIIKTEKAGNPLWWWFLVFAFIFLLLETLLIRIWKTK
jgi:hypothetical protein